MKTEQRIKKLLTLAKGDTGGSSRAAQFLLSLWNGYNFRADLQDLLYIDTAIFNDMVQVMIDLRCTGKQLDSYLKESDIEPVIDIWGDNYRHSPA